MGSAVSQRTERRRTPRRRVTSTRLAATRFVGGAAGRLLDVSALGVAIVSTQRVAPGRVVRLSWPDAPDLPAHTARVARAAIVSLKGEAGVDYVIGLEFAAESRLLWEHATRAG